MRFHLGVDGDCHCCVPGTAPLTHTPQCKTKPKPNSQLRRLPWTATTGATLAGTVPAGHPPLPSFDAETAADALTRPLMVELGPMEIRTFELEVVVVEQQGAEKGAPLDGVDVGEEGLMLME